jgi:hypothetical protein
MPPTDLWSAARELRRRLGLGLIITTLGVFTAASAAGAVDPVAAHPAVVVPCAAPAYHQLDFWLGDWLVYDGDTGQLVAKDRIDKRFADCVVEQNLTFISDMYLRPGVAFRLSGLSVSRFDGERWLQLWADNQWGAIAMQGAADKDGSMVFNTVIPSRGRDVRLIWRPQPGGVVRILQYVAPAGTGKWEKYGDLIYRPDPAAAPHTASVGASTP